MQKRNEKKGASEKKYYESKTHVSGDWFVFYVYRLVDINIGRA